MAYLEYLQIMGAPAVGNKMVPNYANLFMAYLEDLYIMGIAMGIKLAPD